MSADTMTEASPFHEGERQVQRRLGVGEIEEWARKVVRPYLPAQHRDFHTALPFLVVAARDDRDRPWATLLTGPDGFVTSPDPKSLVIDAKPSPGDALFERLVPNADIGILGIELATRRRNRVNGRIKDDGSGALVFAVDQSFGNCPQYIRERNWHRVEGNTPGEPIRGRELSARQQALIASADTFFIASGHRGAGENASFGMDASHRGGEPGFVAVESGTRLVFPDYAGNNHLNTMGNLVLDPRIGLLFVDFESGSLLQITGTATIDWESEAVANVPGARRLVAMDIEEIVALPSAVALRWDSDASFVRTLRLVEKHPESADVTSFVFEARDGGTLPSFEAGQHLPIELSLPDTSQKIERTYSLSGPSGGDRYRISVKREPNGLASNLLHDHIEPGAFIEARHPSGHFILPSDDRPLILVSAGVGTTPMMSMLHALTDSRDARTVRFVHGARDGDHHPFAREARALVSKHPRTSQHVVYSRPRPDDEAGLDYDSVGHIDGALLTRLAGEQEAHFLICGPTKFMADLQLDLEARGIDPSSIITESFG
ncbi:MAG: pyridoxamine 5'-phosphate oxidase family protein [Rhodospirillaceae bacterium]|nr:pyridoxamine 5'-phosphate oxidase family protein [Rhodospirillaceae bacterium]